VSHLYAWLLSCSHVEQCVLNNSSELRLRVAGGCRMVGIVEKGSVLDGQNERMGSHAFERALLMLQQDLGR
jgi:hypothetical protein